MNRDRLVLAIAEHFELSPNFVTAELTEVDKRLRAAGRPDIGLILEMVEEEGFEDEKTTLIDAFARRFNNLRFKKLIEDHSRKVARGTHMSAEQIEAYIMSDKKQTAEEIAAKVKAFVSNLCFAAVKNHREKTDH